jgi:hypothetical protein
LNGFFYAKWQGELFCIAKLKFCSANYFVVLTSNAFAYVFFSVETVISFQDLSAFNGDIAMSFWITYGT